MVVSSFGDYVRRYVRIGGKSLKKIVIGRNIFGIFYFLEFIG